jgi:hypothetical protein
VDSTETCRREVAPDVSFPHRVLQPSSSIHQLSKNGTALYFNLMPAKLLLSSWDKISISDALAFCALTLSVLGYRRSSTSLVASIPEPQVSSAFSGFTVIRMHPSDEHRFAISVIESASDKFLVTADVNLLNLPDIIRGYSPSGRRIRSAEFDPPATSLIVCTKSDACSVKVRVVLKTDHRINKWVEIKNNVEGADL